MCVLYVKPYYISNKQNLITTFKFAADPNVKDISGDLSHAAIVDSPVSDIKDFLQRPVRILSLTWTPGTTINGYINPWSAFLTSSAVANKIANYARIRGKLHLRFLINSNSFYFGSLVFSYIPLYSVDEVTKSRTLTAPVTADFLEIMQRPHILLDPTSSLDRDMILPFLYPYSHFPLTGETVDISILGYLCYNDLNILRHANGSTDPVQITVYAWMDEVDLCVPTTYTSTMQSESDKDIKLGPVSKVCSAVDDIATKISKVPIVGSYATPVSMAAKLGYSVAKSLGFSRPENTQAIHRVVNVPTAEFAATDRADCSEVLALDSANTLSIDPTSVNLNTDDMDLLTLCQRDSYIYSVSIGLDSADTVISSIRVRPILSVTNSSEYHFPILSFCSLPFRYWRGSIKYKFQFVASAYHKGRFRITWDPYPSATNMVDPDYFNSAYTYVLDLEKEREFTMSVPYAHFKPFLETYTSGTVVSSSILTPTEYDNGVLSVMVLNPIVSPNTTAFEDIYMNVYISAGSDFQLVYPSSDHIYNLSYFSSTMATDQVDPFDAESATSMEVLSPSDHKFLLDANGECIMSLRALLKRFVFIYPYVIQTSGTANYDYIHSIEDYDRPQFRGHDPAGSWTNNSKKYNMCTHNLITHFEPCFVARKGGYKIKIFYNISGSSESGLNHEIVGLKRTNNSSTFSLTATEDNINTYSGGEYYAVYHNLDENTYAFDGFNALMIRNYTNIFLDPNLPYYGDRKFLCSRVISNPSSSYYSSGHYAWGNTTKAVTTFRSTGTNASAKFFKFASTREDYSLFFFLSTPVCYFYDNATPV